MIHKVFSVHDSKVKCFLQPFMMPNEQTAVRAMMDCVRDKGHAFNKHPEDYNLFYLGEFDEETGLYETVAPEAKLPLISLVEQPEETS
jgi:hypothetical protein